MLATADSFLEMVVTAAGDIATDALSEQLRITKAELATAAGLSRDAVSKTSRLHARSTQARLRDVAEIIARVSGWAGSVPQAFAWYRAMPLPSFGDRTAEDLVKEGRAQDLKDYLSRIAAGGFA